MERARPAWRERLSQEQAAAAAEERAAEDRAAKNTAVEQSEQLLAAAQLLTPGMEQSVRALTLLLPESTVTRKKVCSRACSESLVARLGAPEALYETQLQGGAEYHYRRHLFDLEGWDGTQEGSAWYHWLHLLGFRAWQL